ncbi:MAG: hypothetical protein QM727_09890 [Niabella sp.]
MRTVLKNNTGVIDMGLGNALPVSFTGDAINHLSHSKESFNLSEWVWHVEVINGVKYCIVTDKLLRKDSGK